MFWRGAVNAAAAAASHSYFFKDFRLITFLWFFFYLICFYLAIRIFLSYVCVCGWRINARLRMTNTIWVIGDMWAPVCVYVCDRDVYIGKLFSIKKWTSIYS